MSSPTLLLLAVLASALPGSWGVFIIQQSTKCIDSATNQQVTCPPEDPAVVSARNHRRIVIICSTLGGIGFLILVASALTYWIQSRKSKHFDEETLPDDMSTANGYKPVSAKLPSDERM
ncbi:hypothetical protein CPB83DRAFT_312750 [Crepidotus variabilis]|uniref:Uncharacterized protein n=1 Tax=Crepidotus variabilis TaxID=179855 RepID=A0A9P6JPS9_9AGAR|nr:hypothetical protein CPB83DRAFT_312750 [Crepidotus variabilis]